jgi:CHAT domain-containing protein/tetratricopeptide (TPR) repeat protein
VNSPPTLDHDARAFAARALQSKGVAAVVRALRAPSNVAPADLAPVLLEEADARQRREPRLAFWLALGAVRAADRAGDDALAARSILRAGEALANQGRMRGAMRLYDRAISRFHRLGARDEVGGVLIRRIKPLACLGRFEEALAAGVAARRVFERLREPRRLVEIENALGDLESRRDRWREALRHYRRARALVPADAKPHLVAILDVNSANALEALHRYGAAKRYFERARATFEQAGLRHTVAQVDQNRAYFAFVRGRYAEALELYQSAETTLHDLSDADELAPLRLELAELHLHMGMPAEARVLARSAAARLARDGRAKESAQALYFAAVAELLEGRSDVAADVASQARGRFHAQENALWVAECDLLRAHALPLSGDGGRAARRLSETARRAFVDGGRHARAASAEILLARIDLAAARPAAALARLDQAEQRTRRLDAPWVELELRRHQGLALLALGDAARGVEALRAAVSILETHRGGVPADEFMVSFLASKSAVYAETIEALVGAGREEEAFECCERSRSRALVDMLSARRGPAPSAPRRSPVLADLKARKLREDLNALYARMHRIASGVESASQERTAGISREIARHETALAARSRDTWARDPEFASLSAVGGIGLDRVRELLDADTTLLEYFVASGRLFAFVVRADSLVVRCVDVAQAEIARRVHRFRFHLAKFHLGEQFVAGAADLYLRATRANLAELAALVVAPIRDALTTRRVVVSPHGVLHGVPFHALPDGDGWLAERFDVSYVPSAAVYGFCAAKTATADGAPTVIALPDEAAPLIAEEAASVAATLGGSTRVHLGPAATAARLREAAATSRVLHLASHGMFRPDRPWLSSIRLADTWLNLYDVYDLDVRADLVVLSACETGVVEAGRGDEALGLLRGFLYAGAPRVLASRWRVSDRTTAEFMSLFYGALRKGETYESALRTAMTTIRATRPHPYHWAAFSLVGDPRGRVPDETPE